MLNLLIITSDGKEIRPADEIKNRLHRVEQQVTD